MYKIVVLFICFLSISCSKRGEVFNLKNGDIIFQISTSSQSRAIQLATHSQYTHVGIIYIVDEKYYVYEAIRTVQLTPLDIWIHRGKNAHFVIKRLQDTSTLTPANLEKMKKISEKYKGKSYDSYFSWSDERMYCSELVWKIYKKSLNIEIGKLRKIKDFDLSHPLVRTKLEERYGKTIPLLESVISPIEIFNSPLLESVITH